MFSGYIQCSLLWKWRQPWLCYVSDRGQQRWLMVVLWTSQLSLLQCDWPLGTWHPACVCAIGSPQLLSLDRLLGSQSEWPKDKPFLLMHSRHARNLYDPKINIIFEIVWTLFEIILFIHLNKHLDGARSTLWKKKYNGLLFATSNEYIWSDFFLIFMHGLKSAISAFLKNCQNGTF